jgi:hypothetical protein
MTELAPKAATFEDLSVLEDHLLHEPMELNNDLGYMDRIEDNSPSGGNMYLGGSDYKFDSLI